MNGTIFQLFNSIEDEGVFGVFICKKSVMCSHCGKKIKKGEGFLEFSNGEGKQRQTGNLCSGCLQVAIVSVTEINRSKK